MMKPFRLINSFELQQLSQHFLKELESWNNTYSINPITMELSLPDKSYTPGEMCIIYNDETPLASIDNNYLCIINQALFGIDKPDFNTASQELFLILLNQLLKKNQCSINTTICSTQSWFYRGSTALLLTLSSGTEQFTIVLNPDWVYQNLSNPTDIKSNLNSLDEAVAEQAVALNLELCSVTLPLNQLITLKAGDVIATDHEIISPLRLTQKEQLIAHAELGQSAHFKSIVLKRSS